MDVFVYFSYTAGFIHLFFFTGIIFMQVLPDRSAII